MKFKGFWTDYCELCKHSMKWFKDYWFLSIIFTILGVIMLVCAPLYVIGYIADRKMLKELEKDVEVNSEENND